MAREKEKIVNKSQKNTQFFNKPIGEALISQSGSRFALPTPVLVLDYDIFTANVKRMARVCGEKGMALRPHAKTHKSATIAKIQIEAGAVGVCCAKIGEAEALAAQGVDGILITSPVASEQAIRRIVALNGLLEELTVVVDHVATAEALALAASQGGLRVLIDLDVGLHRTGVAPGPVALDLLARISTLPSLAFLGFQAYAGHLMHVEDFTERRTHALKVLAQVVEMRDAARSAGHECTILSGGGTGTYDIDVEAGVFTELQAGSYIFMDGQYGAVKDAEAAGLPFGVALMVQMSVVSSNTAGLATTDAGYKSFSADADAPRLLSGVPEGTKYFFFGDEHGGLKLPSGVNGLTPGHMASAITPHCDPTVNLYDYYHVVRGDTLIDIWPIEARGRSY
ncbi:MAG: DSD1 family PLP-dependent enzyme [Parvularculales bacterium]